MLAIRSVPISLTDAEKYELKGAVKELEISYYAENDELGEAVKDLRNKLAITFDKEGRQVKETFYEITADAQGKTIAVVASIARTAYDGGCKGGSGLYTRRGANR